MHATPATACVARVHSPMIKFVGKRVWSSLTEVPHAHPAGIPLPMNWGPASSLKMIKTPEIPHAHPAGIPLPPDWMAAAVQAKKASERHGLCAFWDEPHRVCSKKLSNESPLYQSVSPRTMPSTPRVHEPLIKFRGKHINWSSSTKEAPRAHYHGTPLPADWHAAPARSWPAATPLPTGPREYSEAPKRFWPKLMSDEDMVLLETGGASVW
ncbi:hypothetical protein CYLTODRAFT_421771 [Cylindrobasidium torrendii FP15055 ss-10]|uniref:Uncharacterized protein n=1 Tax=Cylindrobasidium torrendii FP15055 ss-10 TaxID=1314674 RepID=A0A0D7BF82_9AGAR|nr:hypothetical protein CYLTODRAFT_421771 [Cylindrobasidium torrendii FP15055 ss-10]